LRRIWSFLAGLMAGGAVIYFAMNFHLVRANDGIHLIPKVSAKLPKTYADIREFTVADWAENAEIAAALVHANRRDLLDGAMTDTLNNGIDRLFNPETR
jgi:hypothetical protein